MRIALATPRVATSLADGLETVDRFLEDASARGARVVCFPEAYLPGLRGQDFDVFAYGPDEEARILHIAGELTKKHGVAAILGMERISDSGRMISAQVFDADGRSLGMQTKTQIDPSEDKYYIPGVARRMFAIEGMTFGISICHEGWRYPETVRWAAVRGAKVVFHPQHTGTERSGVLLKEWGARDNPYYEQAMMMRSRENTIYFASVNYALRYQESATSLIDPSGACRAHLPYGTEGLLVEDIDLESATGLLARRYAPERYREEAI